ncbi:MAG: proton/sodium-glutamate symport protein GltT [Firmicutes bacterium]|nr:proton/sodium-glutamate symport protein GltT [Bacillota bacterium]
MKKKLGLSAQIFLGLVLGALFGYFFPEIGAKLKPLGDAFIRMIKMIVVPLIFTTLVMGIAGTGDFKKLGRLGGKAILWFEVATTVALAVGLITVNLIEPGVGVNIPLPADGSTQMAANANKSIDMVEYALHIIPTNIVDACVRNDMLQIIFFTCFFGVGVAHIGKDGDIIVNVCRSIAEAMFKVTHYVMMLAPIGIFAMISYTIGNFGLGMLIPLGKLFISLVVAVSAFLLLLIICASFITKINLFHLIKALREPLILAFSTASSEAALPLVMKRLEEVGVPKHVVTFVIPTGYSFNLDGSTLYSALALIFIAQLYGVDIPLGQQLLIMLSLMLSTKGIAGVPGASFIVIAATATAFGLPADGIAIILGIDRILDMIRTFCNVLGNCVATIIVAVWEKELTKEQFNDAYQKNFNV